MGRRFLCGLATALICVLWSGAPVAQETSDLPSVKTLKCAKDCRDTDPKPLDKHRADYPGFMPEDYPTEGFVLLRATVTKDGVLKDQSVVRLIGAHIFADKVLEASKTWHYQPATHGGVPVDRPNWYFEVIFTYGGKVTGARDEVYRIFQRAGELSGEGKHADAIAMLLPVLSKTHLNFYEREAVSLQLAIEYAHQGDILTAREYLDDVTLLGENYLPKNLLPTLWRMAVITNAKTGQLLEAKEAFAKLGTPQTLAADDPLVLLMQAVDEQMHSGKLLAAKGRIPTIGALPIWRHMLMRHSIAILKVVGKLDRLYIECGEHKIESGFSDKAEWHIPKNWDKCRLDVFGDPGSTFTLAEMDD
jgi:TonB family protein